MYFKDFPDFLYDFDITTQKGSGLPASATANISGGVVTSINVTSGGTGYNSATINFSPPQIVPGVTATAEAVIVNGIITEIRIINGGVGYTSAPTIAISTPYESSKTITKAILMKDITRNIRFRRDLLANVTVYDEYDIVDGETPEIIAEKIYGNPEYHWIVMLANDRYDYRKDFPLTYVDLQKYIEDKYGNDADAIHHYLDARGYFVDSDFPGAVSVSNRQYEEDLNESKRRIKIISAQLVNTILKNFRDEL
jgi:hypothetical protein